MNNKRSGSKGTIIVSSILGLVLALAALAIVWEVLRVVSPRPLPLLDRDEEEILGDTLDQMFPERTSLVHPLPYEVRITPLDVYSFGAILVDATTGSILYRKNDNEMIPPASMTKLFVMAVVEDEVSSGHISLDDVVPLPPECYEENMPYDASLMHLHRGDVVTVRELLTGLSVVSGNDAAIALAIFVSGSVKSFVERMNAIAYMLGLKNTHFVEPSGYSADNVTTAFEFAQFSLWYIRHYEKSLREYHSRASFVHNGVTMYNTNKLLGMLDGCDGLKTGYIDESGYNLALTVIRSGRRYLSVTMGGPGKNAIEGNNTRVHDGTVLMDFAFDSFDSYIDIDYKKTCIIKTPGGKAKSARLIQPYPCNMSVPQGYNVTRVIKSDYNNLMVYPLENIARGTIMGTIEYHSEAGLLATVPLVLEKDIIISNNPIERAIDNIVYIIMQRVKSVH